jgi:cation diffusion facilitator family transporter
MPQSRPEGRPETALVRRVFIGLLVANLLVVGAKLAVGLRAGSLAILGSALDSSVDVLNNALALIVVRVAAKAPDEDHPYGHGKFETLGALAIVGFLAITCFELIRGAVNELLQGGHRVGVTDGQLALLVLTLGVNVVLAWYENRRGLELRSELLIADAAHTRTDVLITVGVLSGVLFARQGSWWVDPALAVVVALLIVLVAYRILVRTVPVLVDERALPTREIQETAEAVPGVKSAYGIRSRGSRGPVDRRYAEVTIAVDRKSDVSQAHAIADRVEERLKNDLRLHEVTVHVEPC